MISSDSDVENFITSILSMFLENNIFHSHLFGVLFLEVYIYIKILLLNICRVFI